VEELPAERAIFGRFFAIVRAALASLCIGLVSKARLGAPVSGGKNPVPGGSLRDGGAEQRHRAVATTPSIPTLQQRCFDRRDPFK
jgi:hypothetical protein